MSRRTSPRWLEGVYLVLLVAVLGVAFSLRDCMRTSGLPLAVTAQEHAVVLSALGLDSETSPAQPLAAYVCAFVLYVVYLVGHLAGVFASPVDLATAFIRDPEAFYLLGRTLAALAGATSVYLICVCTKAFLGRWAGLAAALVAAVSPMLVAQSSAIQSGPFATMLVLLGLRALVSRPSGRVSLASDLTFGLFLGLASPTYPHAYFLMPIYVFWRLTGGATDVGTRRLLRPYLASAAYVIGLFSAGPLQQVCWPGFALSSAVLTLLLLGALAALVFTLRKLLRTEAYAACVLATALLLAWAPLQDTLRIRLDQSVSDNYARASCWIAANLPANSNIVVDSRIYSRLRLPLSAAGIGRTRQTAEAASGLLAGLLHMAEAKGIQPAGFNVSLLPHGAALAAAAGRSDIGLSAHYVITGGTPPLSGAPGPSDADSCWLVATFRVPGGECVTVWGTRAAAQANTPPAAPVDWLMKNANHLS